MKKTWKKLIAFACVLSMIACTMPAATLAEDEVATPTDLAPVEEPQAEEPGNETEESEEAEEEPEAELPSLYFGNTGIRGTLKAGQEFKAVLRPEYNWNILVTLTLQPTAGQAVDADSVQMTFNGEKKELTVIENEDPEDNGISLQFGAYVSRDNEYIISATVQADADFVLTAIKRPDDYAEQDDDVTAEEETNVTGEDEEAEDKEETEIDDNKAEEPEDGTGDGEQEESESVRAWISGMEEDTQIGDTITLHANMEPELTGVATWQVRNDQVDEGAWKKAGYGDQLTIEISEGNEYRFVMQDGTISEILRVKAGEEVSAADDAENEEENEDNQISDTEDEEPLEETENPGSEDTEDSENAEDSEEDEVISEELTDEEETETPEEGEKQPEETKDTEETSEEAPEEETNEEESEDETEEETEKETEILPDPEELLALGYYGTQVVMSNGADIFESMEEDAEPVEHLEAGKELWVIPTETEGWAEIYRADEEAPARYIRWDDVIINQKPETEDEEEEEELPARSVEVTSSLWGMLSIPIGTEITMKAELINFQEDDICTFQWQYRPERADTFIDIEDANDLIYVYPITRENFYYTWRLTVLVEKGE